MIAELRNSLELLSIADDNLCRYGEDAKHCKNIELICMDAAKYIFPDDPLVLYLYNPFEYSVMAQVVNNLTASFLKQPRRIIVLYFTPQCADLWDRVGFLKKVKASNGLCIYDALMDSDHFCLPLHGEEMVKRTTIGGEK